MQLIDLRLSYADSLLKVEMLNTSQEPVRIWSNRYSYGYEAIRFQILRKDGMSCAIVRKPQRWTVNAPDFIVLERGQSHFERLDLNDGTWDSSECAVDLPGEIDALAVLEIVPNGGTSEYHVFTGRCESNKLHFQSLSCLIR